MSNAEVNRVESPRSSGLDDWGQTRGSGRRERERREA